MSDNYHKLWVQQNLNAVATTRALAEIERTGRALPCKVTAVDGSIVTVSFEVTNAPFTLSPLTLPKAESQWLRAPTQIGDFGMTMPADTFLGGISGLGSGVADLTLDYGNMTTLVWVPVGSTQFGAAPDPNKAWLNGPAGAVLSDTAQTAFVIAEQNKLTFSAAGNQIVIDSSGVAITVGGKTWTLTSTGFTMSTGVVAETHIHPGVQTGSGTTGPPEA